MGRRYIGGVSGSSFFKQSNNPGDYTTEDIVVGSGSNKFTVPKGTYIGVGAMNEDFKNFLKDYRGASTITGAAIQALYDLRTKHTNWYKDNESKENYGYTDPKTFLRDTYARYSMIEDGTITEDELLEYQTQEEDGRGVVSADAGEGSVGMEDFIPGYKLRYDIDKIKPKKASKIDIEEPEVNMQPAPEIQGGVEPSKSDIFFDRLETAKVYENRPDEDAKGRKKVKTQYVFSDDNPFKPEGRYFMDEADTKGRRKTSGNLNKAREWERKNGLGIQKDIVGYIPSLEFGGAGKSAPFKQDDELGPVLDPNVSLDSQITGTSADIAEEQLDANQGPMVGNTPQYEIDYSGLSEQEFEAAASFAPVAGEVIDAKNTLVDLYQGDYGGAALNAAGFFIPFIPGAVLKKGAKEVAAWVKKNGGELLDGLKGGRKMDDLVAEYNPKGKTTTDAGGVSKPSFSSDTEKSDRIALAIENKDAKIIETDPRFTDAEKAEILTDSKMPWNEGMEYKVRINDANSTVVTDKLRNKGKNVDEFVNSLDSPTVYDDDAFEFVGYSRNKSTGELDKSRPIVEVRLPNGKVQKFYKSSGSGKKAGSAGNWYPLESATSSGWWSKEASRGTYKGKKLEGFYENAAGKRVSSKDKDAVFISVHEQLKRKGVDPDKAFSSGELKLDKTGYDFHYGSKEYKKISDRLDEMPDIEG
jgi:hypothetical protein